MRRDPWLGGLLTLWLLATPAQADLVKPYVSYQYIAVVAGQAADSSTGTTYSVFPGQKLTLSIYLEETAFGGSPSFIGAPNPNEDPTGGSFPLAGVGAIGMRFSRQTGDATITSLSRNTKGFTSTDEFGDPVGTATFGWPGQVGVPKLPVTNEVLTPNIAVYAVSAAAGAQPTAFGSDKYRMLFATMTILAGESTSTYTFGSFITGVGEIASTKTLSFTDFSGGTMIENRIDLDNNHPKSSFFPEISGAGYHPFTLTIATIPEPSSFLFAALATTSAGFAAARRRRQSVQNVRGEHI